MVSKKSIFLFGPRQTGKTTLLKKNFSKALYIDLLDLEEARALILDSSILEQKIKSIKEKNPVIIIDEIQKMIELLDIVHKLIVKYPGIRFILTGSSARKLKRSSANLLGGRSREIIMRPFTTNELEDYDYTLKDYLKYGGLPFIVNSDERREDLKDYIQVYLKQEIKEEGLVRNLSNFSRFLYFAASVNCEQINYTSLGSDAQLPARTVQDYFQVLEDTLIGVRLKPFMQNIRKTVSTDKFYFFDVGVANYLRDPSLLIDSPEYLGKSLEHLVFSEIYSFSCYHPQLYSEIFFWRTQTKLEVDFVLKLEGKLFAIEVKATKRPKKEYIKGLIAFKEEYPEAIAMIVCQIAETYIDSSDVRYVNIADFFKALWLKNLDKI
jgi:predicted AAA+ superfamily ATPase